MACMLILNRHLPVRHLPASMCCSWEASLAQSFLSRVVHNFTMDESITAIISKHCHVLADGTLAWRGRCVAALSEFLDVIGCEDRASALERCTAISDAPNPSVVPVLQEIFADFSSPDATAPCWQAIADAITATAPQRPPRDTSSSLLASIKARRGIPAQPQAVRPVMMHPRDRAALTCFTK